MSMYKAWRIFAVIGILFLAGCKEDIYTQQKETDANMMVTILIEQGIPASLKKTGENEYSIQINSEDRVAATKALKAHGYPKEKFKSVSDVFNNSKIIVDPMEQKVRYIEAVSQQLARSITEIDGVVSANVHITNPATSRFGTTKEVQRASVMVHHYRSRPMHSMKPKIKQLVAHGVSGLTYDNVAVVLSPVNDVYDNKPGAVAAGGRIQTQKAVDGEDGPSVTQIPNKSRQSRIEKTADKKPVHVGSIATPAKSNRQFLSWALIGIGILFAVFSVFLWWRASAR